MLTSVAREVLAEAGRSYTDLTKIVAVNGPGTFAGVRVAISLAHGIVAATGCETAGLGLHQVLAGPGADGDLAVYVIARGGLAMRQLFRDGEAIDAPETLKIDAWREREEWLWASIGAALPGGEIETFKHVVAIVVTPEMLVAALPGAGPLKPLYMRPPDAAKAKQVFEVAGQ